MVFALILAVLVELIFIMHHLDPAYFGMPLELYELVRWVAVVATLSGGIALWSGLKKKERGTGLLVALFLVTALPTIHWTVGNNYFRVSIVIARGDVQPHKLIKYLKDYPETKPEKAASWLFKQKDGRLRPEVFIGRQLARFIIFLPEKLARFEKPVIAAAIKQLQRFPAQQQMAAYRTMLDKARGQLSRSGQAQRVIEFAGSRAMVLRMKTLNQVELEQMKPAVQLVIRDYRQNPTLKLPAPVQLLLTDRVSGKQHVALKEALRKCRLFEELGVLGLSTESDVKKPRYRLKIERTVRVLKTTFTLRRVKYTNLSLPLYTLSLQLIRVADNKSIFTTRSTTPRSDFSFIMTRSGSRSEFQSEIFGRAVATPCGSLRKEFSADSLYPGVKKKTVSRR